MAGERSRRRGSWVDTALAVLNGAVGDHLSRNDNGLATVMGFVHDGTSLPLERKALAEAYPAGSSRVVVLVHGLMCTEAVWRFRGGGSQDQDYGVLLAEELGYSPLYLRYNSGVAIADNGAALAELLLQLTTVWPVAIDEILLIGHSLGGLVIRIACDEVERSAAPGDVDVATRDGAGLAFLVDRRRVDVIFDPDVADIHLGRSGLIVDLDRRAAVALVDLRCLPDGRTTRRP